MDSGRAAHYIEAMTHDLELDARGLLCPLPVLKARKAMKGLAPGQVLRLLATDPAAVVDVPHYARESGHALLGTEADGDATAYYLRHSG